MEDLSRGRFAPSPTGRMHLGNVWAALLSYLSVKSRGGKWILRHEDLDRQRSRAEYARLIEDDLLWLGLEWDEGGVDGRGPFGPYSQSLRDGVYEEALGQLAERGLLYPCGCRRADLLAASAPHASDGRPVYAGTCRPAGMPRRVELTSGNAVRVWVGEESVSFRDRLFGEQCFDLAGECGDFVVRRADGAFAYQLAVVADDAAMCVSEVVRGCDLLPSAAQQIYLFGLLDDEAPAYGHVPLLVNAAGQRLSKRDATLSMAELRKRRSPGEILGILACMAGLVARPEPVSVPDLVPLFSWRKMPAVRALSLSESL